MKPSLFFFVLGFIIGRVLVAKKDFKKAIKTLDKEIHSDGGSATKDYPVDTLFDNLESVGFIIRCKSPVSTKDGSGFDRWHGCDNPLPCEVHPT